MNILNMKIKFIKNQNKRSFYINWMNYKNSLPNGTRRSIWFDIFRLTIWVDFK